MTVDALEYASDELLGLAMIMNTPIVIVEGYDDVPIYERLSAAASVDCEVYASENILRNKPGCEGVIENVGDIRDAADGIAIEKYILGIIDRDARFYRNAIAADPAILVLKYCSIESHFANCESIQYVIPKVTRVTAKLMAEDLHGEINAQITNRLMFLYLVSLEALKNACEKDYDASFGYGHTIKSIINQKLHEALEAKREGLIVFGESLGLTSSWDDLLKICKGKWLLEMFSDELYNYIKDLPELCKESKISQCQFCAKGELSKCLYKNPVFFSADIMRNHFFHNLECGELGYIKARMARMMH